MRQNSATDQATNTRTPINPDPKIPLPTGAVEAGDWEDDEHGRCRVISGGYRDVDGTNAEVYTSAIQLADGRVDSGVASDPPMVWVTFRGDGITSAEAKLVAAALVAAADMVDGWLVR